jgi:hypothetical protein
VGYDGIRFPGGRARRACALLGGSDVACRRITTCPALSANTIDSCGVSAPRRPARKRSEGAPRPARAGRPPAAPGARGAASPPPSARRHAAPPRPQRAVGGRRGRGPAAAPPPRPCDTAAAAAAPLQPLQPLPSPANSPIWMSSLISERFSGAQAILQPLPRHCSRCSRCHSTSAAPPQHRRNTEADVLRDLGGGWPRGRRGRPAATPPQHHRNPAATAAATAATAATRVSRRRGRPGRRGRTCGEGGGGEEEGGVSACGWC